MGEQFVSLQSRRIDSNHLRYEINPVDQDGKPKGMPRQCSSPAKKQATHQSSPWPVENRQGAAVGGFGLGRGGSAGATPQQALTTATTKPKGKGTPARKAITKDKIIHQAFPTGKNDFSPGQSLGDGINPQRQLLPHVNLQGADVIEACQSQRL